MNVYTESNAMLTKVPGPHYKTGFYKILSALLLAPLLTASLLILVAFVYTVVDHYRISGAIVILELVELNALLTTGFVAGIALIFTLVFGLPLHWYLAKKGKMQAKYYCLAGFLVPSPIFIAAATEGFKAALFYSVFSVIGLICAWFFWFFAVENNKAWLTRCGSKVLSLFE